MPQRKDYANDAEHHGKFQVWLQQAASKARGAQRDGCGNKTERRANNKLALLKISLSPKRGVGEGQAQGPHLREQEGYCK